MKKLVAHAAEHLSESSPKETFKEKIDKRISKDLQDIKVSFVVKFYYRCVIN